MRQNRETHFLPVENGASDFQDSSRLAGLCVLFDFPTLVPIELDRYVELCPTRYVRHPNEKKYKFSRDQYVCLIAGLYKQKKFFLVDQSMVDGYDLMPPSVKGHEKRCKGLKPNLFQSLYLCAEIFFHAKFTPTAEPNQLLCMMRVAGREYTALWVRLNPKWKESIKEYWWFSFRNEKELALHLIAEVESDYQRWLDEAKK